MLVVRVGVKDHGALAIDLAVDLEFAAEHVPDLGEVMVVQRMTRTFGVVDDAGVGNGGVLRSGVEHHLGALAFVAQILPVQLVAVLDLHGLVLFCQGAASAAGVDDFGGGDGVDVAHCKLHSGCYSLKTGSR